MSSSGLRAFCTRLSKGTVKLIPSSKNWALRRALGLSTGVRQLLPLGERPSTKHPIVGCSGQMSTEPKEIADRCMYRQESLSLPRRLETAHFVLPLPRRLVGDLAPVVRVSLRDVHDRCQAGTTGSRVAFELVSHQPPWNSALPF